MGDLVNGFFLKSMLYLSVAGMSLILIFHFVTTGKKSFLLSSYCAFQVLILLWAVHDVLLETYNVLHPILPFSISYLYRIYLAMEFICTCFIPYAWLMFSLSFADIDFRGRRAFLAALGVPPAVFFFPNFFGYFMRIDLSVITLKSVLFLAYVFICYAYLTAGIVFLIRHVVRRKGYSGKQAVLLSACILLPLAANIVQNVNMHVFRRDYEIFGIDLSLVAFAVTMLLIAVATFRYRLLKAVPYALKELFRGMEQPVVVADHNNRILERNEAFSRIFSGFLREGIGERLDSLAGRLFGETENPSAVEKMFRTTRIPHGEAGSGEFSLPAPVNRSFAVTVRPVFINGSDYAGKVIVFAEITGLKNMIAELNAKNSELSVANERLLEYSATAEALAVERERARLAGEVHDTLGQSMTIITTLLNAGMISCDRDIALTKEKLSAAIAVAKDGLSELRRVVRGLLPEKLGSNGLSVSLRKLTAEYESSGLHVELITDDVEERFTRDQSVFVYRLCQEALTNAVRHGKAENATIVIRNGDAGMRIFISDDGSCGKQPKKGYGLTGMENRAAELGGRVRFWHGEKRGFNVYAELPLEDVKEHAR